MLERIRLWLQGKKFYLTALAGILAMSIQWASGEIDTLTMEKTVWEVLLGCFAKAAFDRNSSKMVPIFLIGFLTLGSGCGYHLVKYDPKQAQTIAHAMEDNFTRFAEDSEPIPACDPSVWKEWREAQFENFSKFYALTAEVQRPIKSATSAEAGK